MVTGLEFWAPCDSVTPQLGVWSAADTALMLTKTIVLLKIRMNKLSPVATGGFGGLNLPNKAPSPPKWKHETL